jgi:hypothetical protein
MRQGIDGGLGKDEPRIVRLVVTFPQSFLAAGSAKSVKTRFYQLIPAQAPVIEMRKDGIAMAIHAHPAGEARRAEQSRRDFALLLQVRHADPQSSSRHS